MKFLQKYHKDEHARYEQLKKSKAKGNNNKPDKKGSKKVPFGQEQFERFVIDFVVKGMLPLHIVETVGQIT